MSQLLTPRFRVEVSRHRTMNVSRAPFTADNAVINYFQSLTISTTNTQLSPIVIKHSEISNWASTHLKTTNDSHFHDRSTGRRTVVWPFNSFLSHVWKQQDLACFPLINFIFFLSSVTCDAHKVIIAESWGVKWQTPPKQRDIPASIS